MTSQDVLSSSSPKSFLLFRWLGVAGIELTAHGQVLLVDPYLTRIPFWRQWLGKVQSNRSLVDRIIPRLDYILVTHAHYDHMLDVPGLASATRAVIYGSPNTCQLARLSGLPSEQVCEVQADQSLVLGSFTVKVLPAQHRKLPFFTPGPLPSSLQPPFSARQYRLDLCFSFLISVGGLELLVNSGSPPHLLPPADVLFVHPFYPEATYRQLFEQVQPRLVIPTHWDDLWRPLSQPPRPSFQPPRWAFPPIQRVDLKQFERTFQRLDPAVRVCLPQRLKEYDLAGLLMRSS